MVRRLETEDELARVVAALARRVRDLEAKPAPRAWIEIEDQVLSSPAASITFSSITDRYRHLMVVATLRTTRSAQSDALQLRFNSDASAIYDWMRMSVRHETTSSEPVWWSGEGLAATEADVASILGDTASSGNFALMEILIPNYKVGSVNKSYQAQGSRVQVATSERIYFHFGAGIWKNTDPITQIQLLPSIGPNFAAGSRATLYGLG